MGFYYKDSELIGQRGPIGPAGPDGNAIGTIISFMGTAAPDGYLVCDGASYAIADYSDLANFFQTQFGTVNHFGGDGTTTFAVPDLRNLFLRGYHGEAEEQLSGEIGEKQEATEIPGTWTSDGVKTVGMFQSNIFPTSRHITPINMDSVPYTGTSLSYSVPSHTSTDLSEISGETPSLYTSRPVNTAVLFCIKYLKPKTTLVEGGMSESEADAKFLALSGGTMTGILDMGGQQIHAIDNLSFNPNNISGTAINPSSTNSWIYLEGKNKRFSFVSSGVRARLLIGDPTDNRDAATKGYVDDNFLSTAATQETVNLGYGPSESVISAQASDVSTEEDNSVVEEDTEITATWDVIKVNGHASFAQDATMGGNKLRNLATPTHSNDAATKGYVDEQISLNTSAGPAGDQNIYSTNEMVVGTWIDGRSIYRKVFSHLFNIDQEVEPGASAASGILASLTPNIDVLVNFSAFATFTMENSGSNLYRARTDSSPRYTNPRASIYLSEQEGVPINTVYFVNHSTASNASCYIKTFYAILEYTKNDDL